MTYCVALNLAEGLVMASDSRTNAGVDHIATFCKMAVFEQPGQMMITLLSAGNLATTQSVISLLRQRLDDADDGLYQQSSMYDVACLVGKTLKEVIRRDSGSSADESTSRRVDFGGSFLLGGQIGSEAPRLFNIYPQGNFIEASRETPFLQIGESKYGKPILDRVVTFETSLMEAAKCALISFDSTIRSNLSVGLPIDMLCYSKDSLKIEKRYRVGHNDAYFQRIREEWSGGLKTLFTQIPDPDWH